MRHLSLFTGIGGFDLGFERAGMESVGQVEIDKSARTVLERHWPQVPRWEDVREVHKAGLCVDDQRGAQREGGTLGGVGLLPDGLGGGGTDRPNPDGVDRGGTCGRCLPDFDVLTGGFPCQDISVAGKRAGLAGDRSGLWHEFARIIGECLPTWVVIENVPGLLSSNRGRDMGTILAALGDYGYGWAYRVLDAQWFGVAQRRRRVFIVGHLGGTGASQVLAVGQGSAGDTPPSRQAGQGVAGTLEARTRGGGFPGTDAATSGFVVGFAHRVGGDRSVADAWEDNLSPTLPKSQTMAIAYDSYDSQAHSEIVPTLGQNTGTSSGRAGVVMPTTSLRRLTPVECARLQGFPDDWNDHLADTQRYRQFGNAVAVPMVEWIGRNLMGAACSQ